jgi:hypothetical protein
MSWMNTEESSPELFGKNLMSHNDKIIETTKKIIVENLSTLIISFTGIFTASLYFAGMQYERTLAKSFGLVDALVTSRPQDLVVTGAGVAGDRSFYIFAVLAALWIFIQILPLWLLWIAKRLAQHKRDIDA